MCDRLVQSGQCQSHLQLHFRNPHKQLLSDCFIWQSVQRMCEKYLAHLLRHVSYRSFEASTIRRICSGGKYS